MRWIVIVLSLLLCVGRVFWGHREPSWQGSFEAFAHLYMGILLALWWKSINWNWDGPEPNPWLVVGTIATQGKAVFGWGLLGPSLFELVAFFVTR